MTGLWESEELTPLFKSQVTVYPPFAPLSKGGWGDRDVALIVQNGITTEETLLSEIVSEASGYLTEFVGGDDFLFGLETVNLLILYFLFREKFTILKH